MTSHAGLHSLLRLSRRLTFLLLATGSVSLALGTIPGKTRDASASTLIALTLRDLVDRSDHVVVAIPKFKTSRWENGRIVTYTTLAVDSAVGGGKAAGETVLVKTLGGIVGDIGQSVSGEAVFRIGEPVVAFVIMLPFSATSMPLAHGVVGMSQGAMPIVVDVDKKVRIGTSAYGLSLVPKIGVTEPAASVSTEGRLLVDVTTDLRALWAKRPKK